jgi:hypothetical protein
MKRTHGGCATGERETGVNPQRRLSCNKRSFGDNGCAKKSNGGNEATAEWPMPGFYAAGCGGYSFFCRFRVANTRPESCSVLNSLGRSAPAGRPKHHFSSSPVIW